jgi:hypothetical protein
MFVSLDEDVGSSIASFKQSDALLLSSVFIKFTLRNLKGSRLTAAMSQLAFQQNVKAK